MKLVLNFDGVDIEGPEPVPAGVYNARVDSSQCEVKKSQNGNEYFTLTYVIENHSEFAGRKVYEYYTLTKNSMWKIWRVLKALGVVSNNTSHEKQNHKQVVVDFREIHNKPCRIKVSQEEYQGRIRNRVDEVVSAENTPAQKKIAF